MSEKQLAQWTDELTDELLDQAERSDLGDTNNLVQAIAQVRVIRRLAEAYDEAPSDERPDVANNQVLQSLPRVVEFVRTIMALDLGNPNFHNERASVVNSLATEYNSWRQDIRPHIREGVDLTQRAVDVDTLHKQSQVLQERIEEDLETVKTLTAEVTGLAQRVKVLSGETGAGKLAKYYDEQATNHQATASRFLVGAAAAAVALLGAGWLLFASVPHGEHVNLNVLLPDLIIRVFTLGVLGYGVNFCAKGYRANKHLQYSNEHRRNALQTYILFREGATSETVQDIITTELVRAVFSAEETGFLDKSGDKTIIEEQASLLSLLRAGR